MDAELSPVSRFLRSELSFYGTIVMTVLAIAAVYYGLAGRIDLLAQKLDFKIESDSGVTKTLDEYKTAIADHEKRITTLENFATFTQKKVIP